MQAGGAAVQNAGVARQRTRFYQPQDGRTLPQEIPFSSAPQPDAGGEIPPMNGPGEGMQQGIETPDMDAQV